MDLIGGSRGTGHGKYCQISRYMTSIGWTLPFANTCRHGTAEPLGPLQPALFAFLPGHVAGGFAGHATAAVCGAQTGAAAAADHYRQQRQLAAGGSGPPWHRQNHPGANGEGRCPGGGLLEFRRDHFDQRRRRQRTAAGPAALRRLRRRAGQLPNGNGP